MNLVVAMTAYRRPEHTRRAIRAIEIADVNAKLSVFIDKYEDDPRVQEQIGRIVKFTSDELFVDYCCSVSRVGLWRVENAHYWSFMRAFDETSVLDAADAVLAIEDDCLISPDAIRLCHWFLNHPRRDDYLFLNLANCNRPADCAGRELDCVESTRIVSPWAWCFTRTAWEEKIRPQWNHLTGEGGTPRGWDWSLSASMEANGWKSLMPVLPRARNIGRELGENGGAQLFDETLALAACSDGTWGDEFRIVEEGEI